MPEIDLSSPDALAAIAADPWLRRAAMLHTDGFWHNFQARPDNPAMDDWQESYVVSRDRMAYLLKGNCAGGTSSSGVKCANFVLHHQRPPRKDTPFWIIGCTLQQACETCWKEKLLGEGSLPECEIDWDNISWESSKRGWPRVVPLKPWPDDPSRNWCLEFMSHDQGRTAFQARSIGGFWFSEQFPFELLLEVYRGCRKYCFPGGQFAEFTPIDPALCQWVKGIMDNPPPGWKFYFANTECNSKNLAEGFVENFKAAVPDELQATRLRGQLAGFEGAIYPGFRPHVHAANDEGFVFPLNVTHFRGVDWGASEEHPFVCLWAYKDGAGTWFVYDLYRTTDQTRITMDHVVEIIARSIAWGWPEPAILKEKGSTYRFLSDQVDERLEGLDKQFAAWGLPFCPERENQHFGTTYADPSRPGEIAEFCRFGIPTGMASNNVDMGINYVKELLKINPYTNVPKLYIHSRCEMLVKHIQEYRWKQPPKGIGLHAAPPPAPLKRKDDECFVAGQLVDTPDGPRAIETLQVGDKVLSHLGTATVLAARGTGKKKIVRVTLGDSRILLCTATHPLATADNGWVPAGQSAGMAVHCRDEEAWKSTKVRPGPEPDLKPLNMAGIRGVDTPIALDRQSETTSGGAKDVRQTADTSKPSGCTSKSGLTTTDQFPRDMTFTTRTRTPETTTFPTFKRCQRASTPGCMTPTYARQSPQPPSGTPAKRGKPGTSNMVQNRGNTGDTTRGCVSTVARLTQQGTPERSSSIVPTTAAAMPEKPVAMTTRPEYAASAGPPSLSTVTSKRSFVRERVRGMIVAAVLPESQEQNVYNLSTSDGTYFVNGVLVSNCDALRYLTFSESRQRANPPSDADYRKNQPPRRSIRVESRKGTAEQPWWKVLKR